MQDKQHCIGRKSNNYHGFVVAPLRLAFTNPENSSSETIGSPDPNRSPQK